MKAVNAALAPDWPLTPPHFLAGMAVLTSNYPPRGSTQEDAHALTMAWWRVLEPLAAAWLTAGLFDEAIRETMATPAAFLPAVGEFVEVCRVCKQDADREAVRKLPAPERSDGSVAVDAAHPPPRIARDWWDRQVVIGRARQRTRNRLIREWRAENPNGHPPDFPAALVEPTGEQIDAVPADARRGRQRKGAAS